MHKITLTHRTVLACAAVALGVGSLTFAAAGALDTTPSTLAGGPPGVVEPAPEPAPPASEPAPGAEPASYPPQSSTGTTCGTDLFTGRPIGPGC